jgi:hypothetical protein
MNATEIIIYTSDDGHTKIDVRMENETVWLSQAQMVELFQSSKANISEHIKHILDEGELSENSVVRNFRTTAADGKNYAVKYYNLDMILAIGYRVKSPRGTQFRQWATERLREYLVKGFTMNDDLLKAAGGGGYWKELLERIRDIRASEKVMYRQVLDLYATSIDYNASVPETYQFFKIVQNKLHYAASGQTASEIIWNRADAEQAFMGLTTFKGKRPVKNEVSIAKNYMNEKELFTLRRMVNAFFDMAELKAERHEPMYMKDWLETLDKFCRDFGIGVLDSPGSVSHEQAIEKAEFEYKKYRRKATDELTPVEQAYLENLKNAQKKIEGRESS